MPTQVLPQIFRRSRQGQRGMSDCRVRQWQISWWVAPIMPTPDTQVELRGRLPMDPRRGEGAQVMGWKGGDGCFLRTAGRSEARAELGVRAAAQVPALSCRMAHLAPFRTVR